jgi:hypothetical protein
MKLPMTHCPLATSLSRKKNFNQRKNFFYKKIFYFIVKTKKRKEKY